MALPIQAAKGDSTTGAIAVATPSNVRARLIAVYVHLDAVPTTSEDMQVSVDDLDGARYDTVLVSADMATESKQDFFWVPETPPKIEEGSTFKIDFPNTDGATYGAKILYEVY